MNHRGESCRSVTTLVAEHVARRWSNRSIGITTSLGFTALIVLSLGIASDAGHARGDAEQGPRNRDRRSDECRHGAKEIDSLIGDMNAA